MRARRTRRRGRHLAAFVLAFALSGGCNHAGMRLKPEEETDLGRRALDWLLRAAQSDIDVVSCNAIEALVKVAPQPGLPHFRAALHSEAPLVRFAGCVAVGELRDKAALDGIRRCLADADPRVRSAAAFAAYRCGDADQGAVLVNTLSDNPDENLRADAAYLIGRLGESRARKRLRYAVEEDKSPKVRMHIYTALAMLGDDAALDTLIQHSQGDMISRLTALQSLAELSNQRARDALLYRFTANDDYLEARLIAARGLGALGSKAGFALALQSTTHAAQDATDQMRIRSLAALALGAMGDPRALPYLKRLAESPDDPRVQVAACYAICQILPPAP